MNKQKKIFFALASLIVVAVIGIASYALIARITPQPSQDGDTTSLNSSTAEKQYKDAVQAEDKNEYSKAQKLYEQALPYYKSASSDSPADKNTALNIESRIATLKTHQETLEKVRSEEKSNTNPNIIMSD